MDRESQRRFFLLFEWAVRAAIPELTGSRIQFAGSKPYVIQFVPSWQWPYHGEHGGGSWTIGECDIESFAVRFPPRDLPYEREILTEQVIPFLRAIFEEIGIHLNGNGGNGMGWTGLASILLTPAVLGKILPGLFLTIDTVDGKESLCFKWRLDGDAPVTLATGDEKKFTFHGSWWQDDPALREGVNNLVQILEDARWEVVLPAEEEALAA